MTYFDLSYETKTDQAYKAAIWPMYDWMHVKLSPDMTVTGYLDSQLKAEGRKYF